VYVVPATNGGAGWGVAGVFFRDTVYFDAWDWDLGGASALQRMSSENRIDETHCLTAADRSQSVGMRRAVVVSEEGFTDRWTLTNTTGEQHEVTLRLAVNPRMIDLFATRLAPTDDATPLVDRVSESTVRFSRTAADEVVHSATVDCDAGLPDDWTWRFTLPPRGSAELGLRAAIASSDHDTSGYPELPTPDAWRASFGALWGKSPAVDQAVVDLRTLLLRTQAGPYPAAGMPIFINFFGRDALITAMMVLDWQPALLRSVLSFLAARQGGTIDPFREEEPGKILHEVRRGELSRTGRIPFGRYYGSVDATPLFLMAVGEYFAMQDDPALAAELAPAITGATDWLVDHLAGASGLATFEASGSGLTVQSWKDSGNSMVDEHGLPARQPIAVAEVQGYAYAALLAAARLLPERAEALTTRAEALASAFHRLYWLPDMGTYAMALDAEMKPLRVLSSDPGHLLWTGIVPRDVAPTLVGTLMSDALWSGWGLRTLGAGEAAYNPVSYHNGSVWPHDTGLFAMGLARYGFDAELRRVAQAMLDLAEASPGRHMPELVSGFDRAGRTPPIPYTHANAPQAWAASTVIRMAAYLAKFDGTRA
jgi:glycogen debranching enzyme